VKVGTSSYRAVSKELCVVGSTFAIKPVYYVLHVQLGDYIACIVVIESSLPKKLHEHTSRLVLFYLSAN